MSQRPGGLPVEAAVGGRVVANRLKTILSFGADALKAPTPVVAQKVEVVTEAPVAKPATFKPQYKVVPASDDVPPVKEFVDMTETLMAKRPESPEGPLDNAVPRLSAPVRRELPEHAILKLLVDATDPYAQEVDCSSLIEDMHTVLSYSHGTEAHLEDIASMLELLDGTLETEVNAGKQVLDRQPPPPGGYGAPQQQPPASNTSGDERLANQLQSEFNREQEQADRVAVRDMDVDGGGAQPTDVDRKDPRYLPGPPGQPRPEDRDRVPRVLMPPPPTVRGEPTYPYRSSQEGGPPRRPPPGPPLGPFQPPRPPNPYDPANQPPPYVQQRPDADPQRGRVFDRSGDALLSEAQLRMLEEKRQTLVIARQGFRVEKTTMERSAWATEDDDVPVRPVTKITDVAPYLRPTPREPVYPGTTRPMPGPNPERPPRQRQADEVFWMGELAAADAALKALEQTGRAPRPANNTEFERYPLWMGTVAFGLQEYPGYVMPPPEAIDERVVTTEYLKMIQDWKDPVYWADLGAMRVWDTAKGQEDLVFYAEDGVTRIPPYKFYEEWRIQKTQAVKAASELRKAFLRAMADLKDRAMDPKMQSVLSKRANERLEDKQIRRYQENLSARDAWERSHTKYEQKLIKHQRQFQSYLDEAEEKNDVAGMDEVIKAFMMNVPQAPPTFDDEFVPIPRMPPAKRAKKRQNDRQAIVATREGKSLARAPGGSVQWLRLVHPRARGLDAAGAKDAEELLKLQEEEEKKKRELALKYAGFQQAVDALPTGPQKRAAQKKLDEELKELKMELAQAVAQKKSEMKNNKHLKEFPSYQLPGPSGDYELIVKRWIPVDINNPMKWDPKATKRTWFIPEHLQQFFPKPNTGGQENLKSTQAYCIPDPVSMQTRKLRASETHNVKKWDAISMMRGDQMWPDADALARAVSRLPYDPVTGQRDPYEYLTYADGTIMTFDVYGTPKPYEESAKAKTRLAAGEWEWLLNEGVLNRMNSDNEPNYEQIAEMGNLPGPFERVEPKPPSGLVPGAESPNDFGEDIVPTRRTDSPEPGSPSGAGPSGA